MAFTFKAKIYKVGINPCVKVPAEITDKMTPTKGYIPVKGTINAHAFMQTLVPVKNDNYRLYVNGPMLKGGAVNVGEVAIFKITQSESRSRNIPMPKVFKQELEKNGVYSGFKKLSPSRQKEILKYLNYIKTEETLMKNISKVISQLKNKLNARIP